MTHQTSINLYEVDHLMDAARNLLNMLMDLSDKMNTSEAGNSDFSWTGLISTNTLALRLHNLMSHLASATNGICPQPHIVPEISPMDGLELLRKIHESSETGMDSLNLKKLGRDSPDSMVNALRATSEFIDQITSTSETNQDYTWMQAFRFSPILGQPPLAPETPRWTLAIAKLIDQVTGLLTKADEHTNIVLILSQLTELIVSKGEQWLVVLRRLVDGHPSQMLPNSEFLDRKTMDTIASLLDNPNLILSQTTRKYATNLIVNHASSTATRWQRESCTSMNAPCSCTEYLLTFSFTLPSKTASCLHQTAPHKNLPTSRFLLEDEADNSIIIHTDSEDSVFLEYGFVRIGLLMNPVLRARKVLDVLRIADNVYYFPTEVYKDLRVSCYNWDTNKHNKIDSVVANEFSMYAGKLFTYENCLIQETSGAVSHQPLKIIKTSSHSSSKILNKHEKNYLDVSVNITEKLLFKAAKVTIDHAGLYSLKREIESAATVETDFSYRLSEAERFSLWRDLGQAAFNIVLAIGVTAICLAVVIPLSREVLASLCRQGSSYRVTSYDSHKAWGEAAVQVRRLDNLETSIAELRKLSKVSTTSEKFHPASSTTSNTADTATAEIINSQSDTIELTDDHPRHLNTPKMAKVNTKAGIKKESRII